MIARNKRLSYAGERTYPPLGRPESTESRLRSRFLPCSSTRMGLPPLQGRGALRHELTACLRTGRALRMPRARTRGRGKTFISAEIMISQRPAEAADRAMPGHWEGDLILGLGSSAIGTLVERTTRFTMLLHLPRMAEPGHPGFV